MIDPMKQKYSILKKLLTGITGFPGSVQI